jgi:Domain of unknown function (DUF1943)/Lipoprotein amino terminal region
LFFFRSSQECDIHLSSGHLENLICNEIHHFKPFSNGINGATTILKVSLIFIDEEEGYIDVPIDQSKTRTNLIFLHDHQRADGSADEQFVENLFLKTDIIEDHEIPSLFNNLVYSLRNLKHSQLIKIYYRLANEKNRALFMDALPLLRTDAGVSLMRDIIVAGKLSGKTVDDWFFSLTFYKNPTRAMVATLSTLIDNKSRPSAVLGISAIVRTFCQSAENCYHMAEIKEIISKYENQLGSSCATDSLEDEEHLIAVLKGIRNIGHAYNKNNLKQCYQNKSNSMWVRLGALDAIRKFPCKFASKDFDLAKTLQDQQEDSELRIGAYLALVNCPSEATIEHIKAILIKEPINQIGSFVWTHLTNIQESASKDLWKIKLKSIIGNDFILNKWNTDPRKFSRNIEVSYHNQDYKVGGSVDSNIIFSEKSYLPRSLSFNLTTNLFGENINLLEIGGRLEGFEDIVENFFGPEGYFREDNFHKLLKNLRYKREIHEQSMDTFRRKFGPEAKVEEPRGNAYFRLFGMDIHYNSFQGIPSLINNMIKTPLNHVGVSFNDNELDFTKSYIFLDGCIIVPTVLGLPLNLTVNGTSHVNFKSRTKLRLSELFSSGKAHLMVQLYPTISTELSALMSLDAYFAKTGLKSVSKLHTSAYIDASADIQNGRLIKVNINLPTEKVELLEASANLFTYKDGKFHKLRTIGDLESVEKCSSDKIAKLFGLEACVRGNYYHGISGAFPNWYFTGPSNAAIYMNKVDSHSSITLDFAWSKDDSIPGKGITDEIKVSIETPGSKVRRGFLTRLKYDDIRTLFLLEIDFPIWDTFLELKYDWSSLKKTIKGSLTIEGFQVLDFTQQLEKQDYKYEASWKFVYWNNEIINWQGKINTVPNKFSLDAILKGSFHNTFEVSGDMLVNDNNMHLTANLTSDLHNIQLNGKNQFSENGFKFTGTTVYKIKGKHIGTIDLSTKYQTIQQGILKKQTLTVTFKVSFKILFYCSSRN